MTCNGTKDWLIGITEDDESLAQVGEGEVEIEVEVEEEFKIPFCGLQSLIVSGKGLQDSGVLEKNSFASSSICCWSIPSCPWSLAPQVKTLPSARIKL